MKIFRVDPSPAPQLFLLPPTVGDFVSEGSPVKVLEDIIDSLKLSEFYRAYRGGGAPAFDPRTMLKIWILAFSEGMCSSRRVAAALDHDLRFMYLARMNKPDYRTLCTFRKKNNAAIRALFVEIVRLCHEVGMILLERTAIDGTKLLANVSRKQTYNAKRLDKAIENVEQRIDELLAEADATDDREDAANVPTDKERVPEKLRSKQGRQKELLAAKQRLEASGKSSVVVTDPQSRAMKTSDGIKAAYNGQAVVDGANQIIIAADVVQDETDNAQLRPMLEQTIDNTGQAPSQILADNGYASDDSLSAVDEKGVDALISVNPPSPKGLRATCTYDPARDTYTTPDGIELTFRFKRVARQVTYRIYRARGRDGVDISVREDDGRLARMQAKLSTAEGLAAYRKRQQIVEPVFGRLKEQFALRRLRLRGIDGATNEFLLACITHNITKLRAVWSSKRPQLSPA